MTSSIPPGLTEVVVNFTRVSKFDMVDACDRCYSTLPIAAGTGQE